VNTVTFPHTHTRTHTKQTNQVNMMSEKVKYKSFV